MADDRFVMENGRHKGEPITRVPVPYLKWMVNAGHTHEAHAAAELSRRGTTTPTLEVSGHAIDSASLRLRKLWHETSEENEGLHAWLVRQAEAAWEYLQTGGGGASDDWTVQHGGIKFAFAGDGRWPVLKTVMPASNAKGGTSHGQGNRGNSAPRANSNRGGG